MTEHVNEEHPVTSLDQVLDQWRVDYHLTRLPDDNRALVALRERLLAREDNIADVLRLAGQQYGMFPEIVAEVLAQVGLGTPLDDAMRMHIRRQYWARMEWVRQEYGTGQ